MTGDEKPPGIRSGSKIVPFERVKYEDRVRVNCSTIYGGVFYVGTDKGVFYYDDKEEVFKRVIFQDN